MIAAERPLRTLLAVTLLALVAGVPAACGAGSGAGGTSDIRVDTIRDVTFDVEGFDTYAWVGAAAAVRDPDGAWAPTGLDVVSEIRFLVDRELRERGRSQVVQDPKMVALLAVGVDMKAVDVALNPESETKTFEASPKGGVFVYLVHPRTRYVVWAGRAIGDVSEELTIDEAKARLEHAITTMFERFPD